MVSLSHKQKMTDDDCLSKSYEIALVVAVDADHALSELRSELGRRLANKGWNLKLRVIRAVVYKVLEFENDQTVKLQCQYLRDLEVVGIGMRALSC